MKIYLSFIRFHFCVIIFLLRNDTRESTIAANIFPYVNIQTNLHGYF